MAQAMLSEKNTSDSQEKKRKIVMSEAMAYLKAPNLKILTTVYPLNKTNTKKIAVGLQYIKETKSFKPVIVLLNSHYSQGIPLDSTTWTNIKNFFPDIASYFRSEENGINGKEHNRLRVDGIDIIFTTTYGTKSIVFDRCSDEERRSCRKKCKMFVPTVVMQKNTFYGLRNVAVCVDERFRRIERILSTRS